MQEKNNRPLSSPAKRPVDFAGKQHGPQGIDKAPGEETSHDTENVIAQTQKSKGKVDVDPSQKTDQPIENE